MEDTKKFARPSTDSDDSLPSPKRSRRAIQKRVVSVPIQEGEGSRAKGVSECAPPADTWAWRKYGQKPIKGSPYPRGYYRCSSSKGCPARKQVERSRVDPTTLVVTYTCEHNHAWPLPKKHVRMVKEEAEAGAEADGEGEVVSDPDPITRSPPETAADPEPDPVEESSRFSDLIMMMPDDLWYCDVGPTSSTSPPSDTLLYGPIFVGSDELAICESEKIGDFKEENGQEEEDALFAGLGELPEFSTVFRRSYWERPMVVRTAVHQ